jgi:DNA-binding MarR family transcriptional regulator
MSATANTDTAKCAYALGKDGLAELEAEFGLTISALELLSRLAAAEDRRLGLSALASECGLSLSRVSRIMDSLEARGLVRRQTVQTDGRAVEGQLTDAGLDLVKRAQASHFASVQERFFAQLSDAQIAALADIFSRFAPAAAEACTAEA